MAISGDHPPGGVVVSLAAARPAENPSQAEAASLSEPGRPVTPPGRSQNETSDNVPALFLGANPQVSPEPGAFMCDRLTVVVPVGVPPGVLPQIGQNWLFDGDGVLEMFRHRRRMVEGSWTSKVSIQVHSEPRFNAEVARECHAAGLGLIWLRIDGNPLKWFQRLNIFGSPDVWGLTVAFVADLLAAVGLGPESGAVSFLHHGYFNRIDATYTFDLGSLSAAASLLRQFAAHATVAHRRSSSFASTLLFPGRAASLSIYHKGPEMRAHPPASGPVEPEILEYADRLVRFEVVSRSERLDSCGLRECSSWVGASSHHFLFDLWLSFVSRLRFPAMVDIDVSSLSPPVRRMYAVWIAGEDVFAFASRATVYRHRVAVLAAGGPDIVLPKPPTGEVVSFRRVLSPVPASVPVQMAGMLYRPRRFG